MRFRAFASGLYYVALAVNVIAGIGVMVLGGLQRADLSKFKSRWDVSPWLMEIFTWLQEESWWMLPLLVVSVAVLAWLRERLGSPWLVSVVHVVLDELRKAAIQTNVGDPLHHHRATLFKRVQWLWRFRCWPWSGWLVAVERSGHTTRGGVSYFKAPDGADNAEGVAGRVWASDGTIAVTELPAITKDSRPEDIRDYANSAFVTEVHVRKRLPQARSLCGFPIEVRGKRWGVLILDSRSPTGVTKLGEAMFSPMSKTLSKLLEKL